MPPHERIGIASPVAPKRRVGQRATGTRRALAAAAADVATASTRWPSRVATRTADGAAAAAAEGAVAGGAEATCGGATPLLAADIGEPAQDFG